MSLHAKFQAEFRGQELTVELTARANGPTTIIEAGFSKDGTVVRIENLTRYELAYLCREAAKSKRN